MKRMPLILALILAAAFAPRVVLPAQEKPLSQEEAMSKFIQAGFAYKDGQYSESVLLYEDILHAGFESGPLYYNLANSYFKAGRIGKAIANYERARLWMPRDHDLNANFQFVKTLIKTSYPIPSLSWGQRLMEKGMGVLTTDEMVITGLCLVILLAAVHLASLYFSWPRKMALGLMAIMISFVGVDVAGIVMKERQVRNRSIVISDVEAKFEPRQEATTHFELYEGAKIKWLRLEGDWSKIERLDGKEGWVLSSSIEKI